RLDPQDVQYLTAREAVKARLVFGHIERGNALLADASERNLPEKDVQQKAAAEFHAAVDLDPENQFAREPLEQTSPAHAAAPPNALLERVAESQEIHIQPGPGRATFHFSGDVRSLFTELAAAYGVTVQFDDS